MRTRVDETLRPNRRSPRLSTFDYRVGGYFITVCTHNRVALLSEVVASETIPTSAGRIVEEEWLKTADLRPNVTLDAFVIMPNHIHGILIVEDRAGQGGGVMHDAPTSQPGFVSPSQTIGAIVRGFKGATTRRISAMRDAFGAPVWQRNYHEHIIRDARDLEGIRAYIVSNPARWSEDEENPAAPTHRKVVT